MIYQTTYAFVLTGRKQKRLNVSNKGMRATASSKVLGVTYYLPKSYFLFPNNNTVKAFGGNSISDYLILT